MNADAWRGSTREQRLPDDWAERRRRVKLRARNQCEALQHATGCPGTGRECDHIITGDDHSLGNLQWLSSECHKAKTTRDNAQANVDRARLRRRPTENHPGRLP